MTTPKGRFAAFAKLGSSVMLMENANSARLATLRNPSHGPLPFSLFLYWCDLVCAFWICEASRSGLPETPSSSPLFSSGLAATPQPPAAPCCWPWPTAAPAATARRGSAPSIPGPVPPRYQPHVVPRRPGVAVVLAVARGRWQWPWQPQSAPPPPRPRSRPTPHATPRL